LSTPSEGAPVNAAIESPAFRTRNVATAFAGLVLVAGCFARFGLEPEAFIGSFFAIVLLVLSVIDLERRIIPDRIVLPATAVVLASQLAFFPGQGLEWVLASIGAALFFLLPILVYPQGMGLGDVSSRCSSARASGPRSCLRWSSPCWPSSSSPAPSSSAGDEKRGGEQSPSDRS